jgi:hypothetical protein
VLNNGNTQISQICIRNVCVEDVCSADKTSLFYRATLDGSLSYKHTNLTGSKKAMDRECCAVQTCQALIIGNLLVSGEISFGALR